MASTIKTRCFKTGKFAKEAKKAAITDTELCRVIQQAIAGLADDLGGGVFKKRLNNNMYRSIILARGGRYWIYQFLFAKNVQENIDEDELHNLRALAKAYGNLTLPMLEQLLKVKDLLEICDGHKAKIQK